MNRIEKVCSQQYKHDTPRFNDYDINSSIKESINNIRSQHSDLEIIPILNIDTKQDLICVNALIPIKVRNKWIAVSFKKSLRSSYKITVHQLYIDQDDIINKAALVDPKQIHALKWLKDNNYSSYNPSSYNAYNYNNYNNYNNNNGDYQTTFFRYNYKPKTNPINNKSGNNCNNKQSNDDNNNNNNATRPKLTDIRSGDSSHSSTSSQSAESISSLRSLDSFPSLINPSISAQTMMSAASTAGLTTIDSIANGTNNNNNINNNNKSSSNNNEATTDTMVAQLRQQLNDALKMAASVCRDSKLKDQIIAQQNKHIQSLTHQIYQQKMLHSTTTLPSLSTLNINNPYSSTNTIPSLPNLNLQIPSPINTFINNNNGGDNSNDNNSNSNGNSQFNTPSPVGSINGKNISNNIVLPNTTFPVQNNNYNLLNVANQFNVPSTTLPTTACDFSANSFSGTTPPTSAYNHSLQIPNYSVQQNTKSNSPQIRFLNPVKF